MHSCFKKEKVKQHCEKREEQNSEKNERIFWSIKLNIDSPTKKTEICNPHIGECAFVNPSHSVDIFFVSFLIIFGAAVA